MRHAKLGVLGFGALALVGVFLPSLNDASWWETRHGPRGEDVYILVASFGFAVVLAAASLRLGMQRWIAIATTLAFSFVLLKFRGGLFDLLALGWGARAMAIGTIGGWVASIAAVIRPEPAR
ncbi:MAG: hypothetical protein ACTHU0_02425 [Kofleriaceae bacterium]